MSSGDTSLSSLFAIKLVNREPTILSWSWKQPLEIFRIRARLSGLSQFCIPEMTFENVVKDLEVTLTYEDPLYEGNSQLAGIREDNTYTYYLSTSATALENGTLKTVEPTPSGTDYVKNGTVTIGAGETGNEVQFYWKKTDELPALELRAERREDGKFILSYIKEEATEEKGEVVEETLTPPQTEQE